MYIICCVYISYHIVYFLCLSFFTGSLLADPLRLAVLCMLFMPPKNESSLRIDRWKIPENPPSLFQSDYQKNVSWYFFVIPNCQWRIDRSLEHTKNSAWSVQFKPNAAHQILERSTVSGAGAVGSKRKHMSGFSVSCVIHKDLVNLS